MARSKELRKIIPRQAKQLLFQSYSSKQELISEYEKICGSNSRNEGLTLFLLEELEKALTENNSVKIRKLTELVSLMNEEIVSQEKNCKSLMHYAVINNQGMAVKFLIERGIDINLGDNDGCTPLHIAAKCNNVAVAKILLFHGAIYNAVNNAGETPLSLSKNNELLNLLSLINDSFVKVLENNEQIVKPINAVRDIRIVRSVMGAKNKENRTLLVLAKHLKNTSMVSLLSNVWQKEVVIQLERAWSLAYEKCKYQEALKHYQTALEGRSDILGPNSPATLDIKYDIGQILYKLGNYPEALSILQEVHRKQSDVLGCDAQEALCAQSALALVLRGQGRLAEALQIYEEVYKKQSETLGLDHNDTVTSLMYKGAVIMDMKRYDEAANIYEEVYKNRLRVCGPNDRDTISARNNIATNMVLSGKEEEALKILHEVLQKKKKIYGPENPETVRTSSTIAFALWKLKRNIEALSLFQEVLNVQVKVWPKNHMEILNTKFNMAEVLFSLGKYTAASNIYKEVLEPQEAQHGPSHPAVVTCKKQIKYVDSVMKYFGVVDPHEFVSGLQVGLKQAAIEGNIPNLRIFLHSDANVNGKDEDGRTPLHFSIENRHAEVVGILLECEADITLAINKGHTPLHIAVENGSCEIVELLLKHARAKGLFDYVNSKIVSSGCTSLHAAAKLGSFEIVKLLLRYGAVYEFPNKEGNKPIDISTNQQVTDFLKLTCEIFEGVTERDIEIIDKLLTVERDDVAALINARNCDGRTLLKIAIANKFQPIIDTLLKMIEKSNN